MQLKGIYPIVPTPFKAGGELDFESMLRLIRHLTSKKVHGLAILGALGEGQKLLNQERVDVIKHYRKHMPNHMHLIVGVRSAATDPARQMAVRAMDLGADALLLGPHDVQKDPALLGYYLAIDQAVNIPIIIHDFPSVTNITMSVELIKQMFTQGRNIRYIKLEDPPTGAKMQALEKVVGSHLKVFGALGGMYALEELELGAVGIMTGFVFSELLVRLFDLTQAGDWHAAARFFYDFVPLNRWEFQPGIGISLRKKLFKQMGIFTSAKVRHPGAEADDRCVQQLWRMVEYLREKGYQI